MNTRKARNSPIYKLIVVSDIVFFLEYIKILRKNNTPTEVISRYKKEFKTYMGVQKIIHDAIGDKMSIVDIQKLIPENIWVKLTAEIAGFLREELPEKPPKKETADIKRKITTRTRRSV